jgi:hypothetical protein
MSFCHLNQPIHTRPGYCRGWSPVQVNDARSSGRWLVLFILVFGSFSFHVHGKSNKNINNNNGTIESKEMNFIFQQQKQNAGIMSTQQTHQTWKESIENEMMK